MAVTKTPTPGVTQLLLKAAAMLPDEFDYQTLTVAAFGIAPEKFCLRGHPHLANSKTIAVELVAKKALLAKGWFERTRPGRYRLTEAGRVELRRTEKQG